jgi:DNA processing protein
MWITLHYFSPLNRIKGKKIMLLYQIALTLVPGIGDILGKKLVMTAGSAEAVFREPARALRKIHRSAGPLLAGLKSRELLLRAEREVAFIHRSGITPLFFTDPSYPKLLRNCIDSPVMVYYKGNVPLNDRRTIGIVGTRKATDYGKGVCRRLVEGLTEAEVTVVSGLAYGIDSCAHRAALDNGLPTIGVLGHGLDRIYPPVHRSIAEKMVANGGVLTDFMSGTEPDRENFPKRNRIIAGLCDALVVVEAAVKGGALITAEIANSYNRDVFAVPGRLGDPFSEGTNFLIMSNKAGLIQSADDISVFMGWKKRAGGTPVVQRKIFIEMTPEEEKIVALLGSTEAMGIDEIMIGTGLTMSRTSCALLNLEFEGVVRCLPGKVYQMV